MTGLPLVRGKRSSLIGYLWLSEGLVRTSGTGHEWVVRAGGGLQPIVGIPQTEAIVAQQFLELSKFNYSASACPADA